MTHVAKLWYFRHLILHKAWADFRAEAERSYLGVIWWVLDPLINMAVYYLVFGVFLLLLRSTEDFVPFLIIGIVAWRWFEATVKTAMRSIHRNRGLIEKVSFDKLVFPISAVLTQCLQFAFSIPLLFGILLICRIPFSIHMLAFPVLLLVQLLLIYAVSIILSATVPLVPDIATLMEHVLRITFYMSGIFYNIHDLPPVFQKMLWLNPMAVLIDAQRQVLMRASWPDWEPILIIAAVSLLGVYLGATLVWRLNQTYAKAMV
jgi:lipopolysaccharide transport system permease protein